MTRALFWLVWVGLAPALPALAGGPEEGEKKRLIELASVTPLRFERNQGQTDDSVEYLARGAGYRLFLRRAEAVLALTGRAPSGERSVATVRMKLVGANRRALVSGLDELPGRSHYFVGKDPARWRRDVRQYARVLYRGVYSGTDLVFHGGQGRLEYDFVVSPGADPGRIRLAFEGAQRIRLAPEGHLVLETEAGELVQRAPVVYEESETGRRPIAGRYVRRGNREVAFEVGEYDQAATLVIDPVLVYSSYLGGSGSSFEWVVGATLDSAGNIYLTGETDSADFPTAGTPYQASASGLSDVFVTKLATSSGLVYSTYLGGSGADRGFAIEVDGTGHAYVIGDTTSTDFPTAGTPSQPVNAGGGDAFVAKLGPTGGALVYSTFAGGSAFDVATGLAVDGSGNAYASGLTYSADFPTAGSPFQPAHGGGSTDAFVMKLDPTSGRVYSTYLGGNGFERGAAVEVDGSGSVYVAGWTGSTDFPTAGTPSQTSNAGLDDAFVAKLAPTSALVYSTYIGGSSWDAAYALALDPLGNVYVTGHTESSDFPTAGAPSQPASGGFIDAWVAKLGPGSQRLMSTYLGGSDWDIAEGIALDAHGLYVSGSTWSADFPTAGSPIQATLAGRDDAFLAMLDTSSARRYSTYLGGAERDYAKVVLADGSGTAYVAGWTASTDFPTAGTPVQASHGGGTYDGFVARVFEANPSVDLFTVSPCRVIDTRNPAGPVGGPALAAGAERVFTIVGACGVPVTAKAVSVNVAVTGPTAAGNLRLYPAGTPAPQVSSINYAAGQTRSNNAIVTLSTTGQIAVRCAQASGTAHFVLDVNGYFQ